jgi:hypothetical protein
MTNLKKKLVTIFTKATQKFRKGDNEKGFIGAGVGASLIAIGSTGYLGKTIGGMVSSLTSTNSTTTGAGGAGSGAISGITGFVNDVMTLIGIVSLIVGIMEYRRLKKQIFK